MYENFQLYYIASKLAHYFQGGFSQMPNGTIIHKDTFVNVPLRLYSLLYTFHLELNLQ